MTECSVVSCSSSVTARGWCEMHYSRWRRYGDPSVVKKPRSGSPSAAFVHYMPGPPPPAPSPTEGCWEWTGTRTPDWGYGTMFVGGSAEGKRYYAHRVSYELFVGRIPDGLVVRHSCDNPPCVQPAHLLVGTHGDNVADMRSRNRGPVGTKNGNSRLSSQQVAEVRALWAAGGITQRAIAAQYGVGQAQVSRIVGGKQRSKG